MEKIITNTNQVVLVGEIASELRYSHQVCEEGFYLVDIAVKRDSGVNDTILLMISERLIDVTKSYMGKLIEVTGQFRSFNLHEDNRSKLKLSVFVHEFRFIDEIPEQEATNQIYLDGFLCKPPIYRKTPYGREITDILLAVNRAYGKTDYIPCIAWGRNARFTSSFEVGKHVKIWGRIQSRQYIKKEDNGEETAHIVYELSITKIAEAE